MFWQKVRITIAKRIKEIAKENKVEIVENKPLARALYSTVDINTAIPPELYQAVAEVLAFVYGLKGKAKCFLILMIKYVMEGTNEIQGLWHSNYFSIV